MTFNLQQFETVDASIVVAGWILFGFFFLIRRRPPRTRVERRDWWSLLGMFLQGIGGAVAWWLRRPADPGAAFVLLAEFGRTALVTLLMAASMILCYRAIRTLGKQWSLAAQVVESHDLITDGPYRVVRHPIYTGILGGVIATGIAVSTWPGLIIGVLVCVFGTVLRIRREERLLRATFGESYVAYAKRVPAIVPWVQCG